MAVEILLYPNVTGSVNVSSSGVIRFISQTSDFSERTCGSRPMDVKATISEWGRYIVGTQRLTRILLICVVLGWFGVVSASHGLVVADFSTGLGTDGAPPGWEVKEKAGRADLSVVKEGAIHALRLRSQGTSFSLQKPVNVDPRQFPVLSWKWKVTKLPEGGDVRKAHADDQAAQLFIGFDNSNVISYIWDTNAPEGVVEDTWVPPFLDIKTVVVRSGNDDAGRWLTENRNAYEDYVKLFGQEPPKIAGIRIQINSQHTDTSGESYFADVVFRTQ
jgi:hypothetical protein